MATADLAAEALDTRHQRVGDGLRPTHRERPTYGVAQRAEQEAHTAGQR